MSNRLSRARMICKLGNAIREYRGMYSIQTKKWVRPPKPQKAAAVMRWLELLGFEEPVIGLAEVQEFKTVAEMEKWIGEL